MAKKSVHFGGPKWTLFFDHFVCGHFDVLTGMSLLSRVSRARDEDGFIDVAAWFKLANYAKRARALVSAHSRSSVQRELLRSLLHLPSLSSLSSCSALPLQPPFWWASSLPSQDPTSEEEPKEKIPRPYAPRGVRLARNPLATYWYRNYVALEDPSWAIAATRRGKLFRTRFRVPYQYFLDLVADIRGKMWVSETPDCTLRLAVPLELKVLGALRILGRGAVFDDIAESIDCHQETIRVFFIKFVMNSAKDRTPKSLPNINSPKAVQDLMEDYRQAGFPGAIGAADW